MANTEKAGWAEEADPLVISGLSLRFPESDTVAEFAENLYGKVDMVTENDRRWEPGAYGLPRRHGTIRDLSRFDAQFFGVYPKLASNMDPQVRNLLELTYEAIIDAGVNPWELRGRRIGVYVGSSGSEYLGSLLREPDDITGYALNGCASAAFANRVSFSFDLRGPSFAVDTACNSSLLALQLAVNGIRSGECEGALVCGSNITLTIGLGLVFHRLGVTNAEGSCKSFDADGTGYAKSEGIAVVFIQRSSDARRIYAHVIHAKSNTDGYKDEGINYPSGQQQAVLMAQVYEEAGVPPNSLAYLEAHGTGTKVGDPQESIGITKVFLQDRKEPLLVGSVKSNMGHAEPASGLASIAKVVIAMENLNIPPNLNYYKPNPDIAALVDGRLKVVTEATNWEGGYVGVNSFGFGGANTHVLLRTPLENTIKAVESSEIPTLLCYSGRTKDAVKKVLTEVEKHPSNTAFHDLLRHQSRTPTNLLPFRGYILLQPDTPTTTEIQKVATGETEVWGVFSGMGTQWRGMGAALLGLTAFRDSILDSAEHLKPMGLDLMDLILNGEYSDVRNAIVANTAIQIALVDVLSELGIELAGIVGHSTGELACSYADGGLSRTQTVQLAFHRGDVIRSMASEVGGSMAAVGMTWDEAKQRLPKGVFAACQNGADSVSVSGEPKAVSQFVEQLKSDGVFAKEVDSSGIAFHSPRMKAVEAELLKRFRSVIPNPKPRSQKWISTSGGGSQCSAEYHVQNVLSPVLFHDAIQCIPSNAITIEVAPHGLLQAILRRNLPPTVTNISLMKKSHPDNLAFFLAAIGKLYMAGLNPSVDRFYPKVEYPVPRGTPMISPLMEWDHSHSWPVWEIDQFPGQGNSGGSTYLIDPFKKEAEGDAYLMDHVIDGRVLFPFTGHMVLAWRTLCRQEGLELHNAPVTFHDVRVLRPLILTHPMKLSVSLLRESGAFEVTESGNAAARGFIQLAEHKSRADEVDAKFCEEGIRLLPEDIYKELRLRGYEYGPKFRALKEVWNQGQSIKMQWDEEWIPFLDGLLQSSILWTRDAQLRLPVRLRYASIHPQRHLDSLSPTGQVRVVRNEGELGVLTPGVEFSGLTILSASRRLVATNLFVETVEFVPHHNHTALSHAPHLRDELETYVSSCEALLQRLEKKLGSEKLAGLGVYSPSTTAGVKECQGKGVPGTGAVMKVLEEILELNGTLALETARDVLDQANLDKDHVIACAWLQRPTKALSDTSTENCPGHVDRACAFRPNSATILRTIRAWQLSHPQMEAFWTVIGENVGEMGFNDIPDVELIGEEEIGTERAVHNLVVLDRVLCREQGPPEELLKKVSQELLMDSGFILVSEFTAHFSFASLFSPSADFRTEKQWMEVFKASGLLVAGIQGDQGLPITHFLLRPPPKQPIASSWVNVEDTESYEWVEELKQKVESSANDPQHRIWLTSSKTLNGTLGLAHCLREEQLQDNRFRSLIVESDGETIGKEELEELIQFDLHENVRQNGVWGSMKHFIIRTVPARLDDEKKVAHRRMKHAYLNCRTPGDLSSICWEESRNELWKEPDADPDSESLCEIHYASINFRDVMVATGRFAADAIPDKTIDRDCVLGCEYSGRLVKNGRRIMGMAKSKALATTIVVAPGTYFEVPDSWSLEEAATIPVVYSTAYYALIVRGRLEKGESVLIHSGSGGVGLASISVALSLGCEVFTTVGSEEKRDFLRKRFPQLLDDHISNSRSTQFERDVMRVTKGRGVDVVLNSLAEDLLKASVRCLAEFGRFLEIGKYDLTNDSPLGMGIFLRNAEFHGVVLETVYGKGELQKVIKLVKEGIETGVVQPLPTTVFPSNNPEAAFRYMSGGTHKGKVLIKMHDEGDETSGEVEAECRTYCHPERVYLITGGLGGVGLQLAHWLVRRGATKLVLVSRSGVKDGYQARCMETWEELGINVRLSNANLSSLEECERLIRECEADGGLGGLFHLAMVLRDGLLESQKPELFQQTAVAKFHATQNLDLATRKICGSQLKWFVGFSSVVCGRGNVGQIAYGWGNAIMERIIAERRAAGLAGMSIQWGAIGDVGVIVEEKKGDNHTVIGGTLPQRIPSVLNCLDNFLSWNYDLVSCYVRAETSNRVGDDTGDIVAVISKIIGITDPTQLHPDTPFVELGLDSLMGMEIKQAVETQLNQSISMKEIFSMTLNRLEKLAIGKGGKKTEEGTRDVKQQMREIFRLDMDIAEGVPEEAVVRINEVGSGTPIFFVHAIEGIAAPLRLLASHLLVPAYGFQCVPNAPLQSIPELARFYIAKMKEIQPEGPWQLVGYSYGAVIAFEMALALGSALIPAILLLDGSHYYSRIYGDMYRAAYGLKGESLAENGRFESELVTSLVVRFADVEYDEVRDALLGLGSWEERVEEGNRRVLASNVFTQSHVFPFIVNGVRGRFLAADQYYPEQKFHGRVGLQRAKQMKGIEAGEDYGLHTVVEGGIVEVEEFPGDHASFLKSHAATAAHRVSAFFFSE